MSSRVVVEPPRDAAHGDLATNAAMVLAKEARHESARARRPDRRPICAQDPRVVKVEVAGPGLHQPHAASPHVLHEVLRAAVARHAMASAASGAGAGRKVNVEYVSANPTGPMHVGHGRGAVFGDALANLLAFAGHEVTREYYINDAGAQVDVLARSAFLRYREALGEDDRRDPRGALSRRLPEARRRGARARARRRPPATSPRPNGCRSCARSPSP